MIGKVAIVMGSTSDAELMQKAADALDDFGIENRTYVISAHRTPHAAFEFASKAEDSGLEVQRPSGVRVETVAIDGARNAGILAAQILGVKYPELREAVKKHKDKLARAVQGAK